MANPKRRKPDDPEQSQRFIDMAREVEASESPEIFERTFDKAVPLKPGHASTRQPSTSSARRLSKP